MIKPGTSALKQRMYQISGELREKWADIIASHEAKGWLEDGVKEWSSQSFPVPKKMPLEYRLVVDYQALNAVTVTDAHPFPGIEDILRGRGSTRCEPSWTRRTDTIMYSCASQIDI